jgi:translation initiation factor 3 subunit L
MYKHKTHVINDDGSVLSNADVDFYVADVSNSSFH